MGLVLATKAFFKALRNKEKAKEFLSGQVEPTQIEQKVVDDPSHLRLLALLQKSGRLLDFLKEDIGGFTDQQVGAAARQVHHDCASLLEDVVTVRALTEDEEGAQVTVPAGYDPREYNVTGNVSGDAPYQGRLVHRGWRAHKRSLPKQVGESVGEVLFPAEVEIR